MATKRREDTLLANWKCMLACILVSMSPFQYGIDFGLIGGIQAMVGFLQVFGYKCPVEMCPSGYNLTPEVQQLIGSLMTLGAIVASAAAGPLAWRLGRRSCLWMACLLCAVSDAIMMGTSSVGALYFGRLLIGISNGLFMSFSQLYLQECTPAQFRGLALSAFQFWTSAGALVGTIVDNYTAPLAGKPSYLIPLGLIYIVPFFIAIGLFLIPESPRWLMEQGKPEKAKKSLLWLRPNKDGVDGEIASIQAAIDEDNKNKGKALFIKMWTDPIDRRRTWLAIAAVSTQAASGAMFMIAYGTYFFEMAGVGKPFENAVVLNCTGVIAIIINSCVITRFGRRRIFLVVGLVLCAVFQLIIAAVYNAQPKSDSTLKLIVTMSVLYIVAYNGMISSYAWVSGGELPSQQLRSYTFGAAAAVGFLGAWLATYVSSDPNLGRQHTDMIAASLHPTSSTQPPSTGAQSTATSGHHLPSSQQSSSTSTFQKSRAARSKRLTRCFKLVFQLASSASMSALAQPLLRAELGTRALRTLPMMTPRRVVSTEPWRLLSAYGATRRVLLM